jgi:hypothetical protein
MSSSCSRSVAFESAYEVEWAFLNMHCPCIEIIQRIEGVREQRNAMVVNDLDSTRY